MPTRKYHSNGGYNKLLDTVLQMDTIPVLALKTHLQSVHGGRDRTKHKFKNMEFTSPSLLLRRLHADAKGQLSALKWHNTLGDL